MTYGTQLGARILQSTVPKSSSFVKSPVDVHHPTKLVQQYRATKTTHSSFPGHLHTLQRLLRDDADINALGTWDDDINESNIQQGRPQWTMLTIAAYHQRLSTVKFLIIKGASIDFRLQDDDTALMIAAHQGHAEIFILLLEHGADITRKRFGGASVLHEAVADVSSNSLEGKFEIMNALLGKNFPIDAADDEGHTALHHAALIGTLALVTLLVNRGANLNAKNEWGDVPLDKAALGGWTDVVEFLIHHGAAVNNADGCNGLAFAASNGHGSIVTLLLDHGAKAVPESSKRPELLCAARSGDVSIVKELIRRGFASQATKALFKAVLIDTVDVVRLLIDHGAVDVNARNRNGQSVLHLAVLSKRWERSNMHGVVNPRIEVLALLLDRGADVKAEDSQGQTPRQLALATGYTAAVELLDATER